MSLLVCVPTYNEQEAITEVIRQLRAENLDFIICDGFSTDGTRALAEQEGAEVLARSRIGKGSAISDSLELARERGYTYMATIDCDLTYSVKDIVVLYDLAVSGNYDMVVGSRPFSEIAFHRRMANRMVSLYFNLLWKSGVKDIVTGLRIMRVASFAGKIHANNFDLEPRILAISVKEAMKIIEVPITYTERVGDSKANLLELWRMLWGATHEKFRNA